MIRKERVQERMQAVGLGQAALARELGMSQQAVGKIVNGETKHTARLPKLARLLVTSEEYLTGETDDPRPAFGPPPPRGQFITMRVELPNEAALARMFEGLLRPLDRTMPVDELARTLARRLPIGLSQLQDLMPSPATGEVPEGDAVPPAPAKADRASRRARRT